MSKLEQAIISHVEHMEFMDRVEARIEAMFDSVVIGDGEPEFARRPTQVIHPALIAALQMHDAELGGAA